MDFEGLASLVSATTGLIGGLAAAFVLVWNAVRTSRRERPAAARRGAEELIAELAAAAADGNLTPEELADLVNRPGEQPNAATGGEPQ